MRTISIRIAAISLWAGSASFAAEPPICPDRPSKSTGPCTVPTGKVQVETGLIDWTRDRSGGARTDTSQWGSSLIKYGLSSRADVELGVTPLETLSIGDRGVSRHDSSFGDTTLRVKYRLTREGAPVQVALDPFVKLPTASHRLGNGEVEGGLLAPVAIPIGKGPLTFSLGPELDLLADADGRGHHLAMQQVVNLGFAIDDRLSLSTELWSIWDWEAGGTGRQASWDASAAYLATNDLQLDAGANVGLNRKTPDIELYTGISVRF